MVNFTRELKLENSAIQKTWKLTETLNCKDNGIYVAICKMPGCGESYVGQTTTSFNKRWSGHRFGWKESIGKTVSSVVDRDSDKTALSDHYKKAHASQYAKFCQIPHTTGFDKSFDVVFVDTARGSKKLSALEDSWRHRTKSTLNRCSIITPNIN